MDCRNWKTFFLMSLFSWRSVIPPVFRGRRAVRVSGKSQKWTRSIHPATYEMGVLITSPLWSGEGNGNPLQYSCLENSMERGAWWATIHGVTRVRHNLATKPPANHLTPVTSSQPHFSPPGPGQSSHTGLLGAAPRHQALCCFFFCLKVLPSLLALTLLIPSAPRP